MSHSTSYRVQVGDIQNGSPIDLLMRGEKADIVYSDPPWGQGNLTYWRTHNGERERVSWVDFIGTFCAAVVAHAKPGAHVFVEMGERWVDEMAAIFEALGLPESQRWRCFYSNPKLPNVLWYSGPGTTANPSGMSGVAMTAHVLRSVATVGALVLDPCCGKGMTGRTAMRLGMRFAGNELNPKRLAVTQSWCERYVAGKTR